jgi:hypothetical protein
MNWSFTRRSGEIARSLINLWERSWRFVSVVTMFMWVRFVNEYWKQVRPLSLQERGRGECGCGPSRF